MALAERESHAAADVRGGLERAHRGLVTQKVKWRRCTKTFPGWTHVVFLLACEPIGSHRDRLRRSTFVLQRALRIEEEQFVECVALGDDIWAADAIIPA